MDLSRSVKLIEGPELDPEHAQGYRGELEVAFRRLMSATFEATDSQEGARLAATEM